MSQRRPRLGVLDKLSAALFAYERASGARVAISTAFRSAVENAWFSDHVVDGPIPVKSANEIQAEILAMLDELRAELNRAREGAGHEGGTTSARRLEAIVVRELVMSS
ncbi:hypothetical protein JCM10908_002673 [Rhodotorula pacifica]|uniref:uncharacterized protein n=1 Tax=Rhodotorula pacifica TaxID=1495444 RepID=UPI00317013C2